MTPEAVTLVIPLPSGILSPNRPPGSFGGRMKKAAAAKRYRRLACEAAREQGIDETWARATVAATFYHAQSRRRDDVNHLAMLKPAYDGIVDSGLLKDDDADHLTTLPARFFVDRAAPRVELVITRIP
jgi:hypothetical protein